MSVDMNKTMAEASLDNLHDIIIPKAVGFLPSAPGWTIVLLLLLALLFHFAVQRYKYYKKSQYRREALREFVTYKHHSKEDAIALLALGKRVGIAAYGRTEIAKLSADSWWDFMQEHSKVKVNSGLRQEIDKLLYDANHTMNSSVYDNIAECISLWIKTHRVEKDV